MEGDGEEHGGTLPLPLSSSSDPTGATESKESDNQLDDFPNMFPSSLQPSAPYKNLVTGKLMKLKPTNNTILH